MGKRISGTKEWAVANKNCLLGCSHDCRYCYARANAVRFKRATPKSWKKPKVNQKEVDVKPIKAKGTIMFPTTHDILPDFLDECIMVIGHLLAAGNNVLIVSKPHMECIRAICARFGGHKKEILFRFTIGCKDDAILGYWEPNAPKFQERFDCLQYAHREGFQTSVSVEPMLDSENVVALFDLLSPYVTDGIWIGKMNNVALRVPVKTEEDRQQVARIVEGQTDEKIWTIYEELKDAPQIRWKESIKSVVGIPLATKAGEDR